MRIIREIRSRGRYRIREREKEGIRTNKFRTEEEE
jgi:hypothetical protein